MAIILNSLSSNKTKAQVKQRALEMLGITSIGQAAQSQDDTRMDDAYIEVYEDLKTEGLAVWAELGAIPNEIAPHLISLMALNGLGSYSVSVDRFNRIVSIAGTNGIIAKREIRVLVTPDYESLKEPTDF